MIVTKYCPSKNEYNINEVNPEKDKINNAFN